ncbi:sodium-dependent neutral amino acid transporter SLC6A17-like [Teleopsis dalmanni]|uniref:sodium-dependent neutral amino acid transporter SLC6A17-like n=1 Tax=Teleopsis dalmanni TaxID=139649 RepID=UPI0018CC8B7A|nr:sodium-dependent neutral amino acid transporter SLC6A17-like [Teleopsis dalmanni]
MVYETSYETGRMPFRPDTKRGQWATPTDFIVSCLSFGFKTDFVFVGWYYFFEAGVAAIFPYLICLALYVVPIIVIQCFMGQFSSSGYISAFRVSPFFKGMGYVSLALNLITISYYAVFLIIPMHYMLQSFRPTIPWSCEGVKTWIEKGVDYSLCNITTANYTVEMDVEHTNATNDFWYRPSEEIPSSLYFKYLFESFTPYDPENYVFSISWPLVVCNFIGWGIIAFIFYYFFEAEKLGKLLRYGFLTTMGLLVICLARFLFLPGVLDNIEDFFLPSPHKLLLCLPNAPFFVLAAFGGGWGSIISLSSLNKFKTNIMRQSWLICFGQLGIFLMFGMVSFMIQKHFHATQDKTYYEYVEHHLQLFLSTGTALVTMELANLWSIIYYGMMTLASIIMIVTQLFSTLLAIYDEFEVLRERKHEVSLVIIGSLALISTYYCSSHGIVYFMTISTDALLTQTVLHLILLLVVLWIYGRERFQRDIEFMLGQRFSTWKVNMLRFISPICLLFTMLITVSLAFYEHLFTSVVIQVLAFIFILLPWLAIPGYGILSMLQTTGSIGMRFKRCCRPTDWYPVEADDRQRYEDAMGNMDITHQLNEVTADAD